MATIKVILDSYKKEDGSARVLLRCGNEKYPTGVTATEVVDGIIVHDKHAKTKNKVIAEKVDEVTELMLVGYSFHRACVMAYGKKEELTLLEVWDEFAGTKTPRTKVVYDTARKTMAMFDGKANLADVDALWLARYDRWMADVRGLKTNTRSVRMRCLRAVINHAIDEEYIVRNPFRKFRIKQEETVKRSLTMEQLVTLMTYKVQPFQERYVDIFMLMLYLIGINTTDLFALTNEDYKDGYITYRRAKTHKPYTIKVEPEAEEIIAKYRGKDRLLSIAEENDYTTFGHLMAKELKRIGEWKGDRNGNLTFVRSVLPSGISAYWARHTWATLASEAGVPLETIAQALGHSNGMSTTSIYVRFDKTKVDKANRKVLDEIKKACRKGKPTNE